jgi:serine/threonine-protein kinase
LAASIVTGVAVWSLMQPEPDRLKRLAIPLPEDVILGEAGPSTSDRGILAVSPDGENLVYAAERDGQRQLYLRPLDQIESTALPGTEKANGPFFSPDGRWIGFWASGKLKKMPLSGGTPTTLCDAELFLGASWSPDNSIVFSSYQELMRVSASGGPPESLMLPKREESIFNSWPEILPRGEAVLYTEWSSSDIAVMEANIAILSIESGEWKILVQDGSNAHYLRTGHIVFERAGSLQAVPFDLDRLEIAGAPVPVLEGMAASLSFGISGDGTLVYIPSGTEVGSSTLVWVDRQGAEQPVLEEPQDYGHQRFSPDGRHMAVVISSDIWLLELDRGTMTRLTFGGLNTRPFWSPDGRRIGFSSIRGTESGVFWMSAEGTGEPEPLMGFWAAPTSLTSDGEFLVFHIRSDVAMSWDIGMLHLASELEPEILFGASFNEHTAVLSPDDRWLAYVSDESGQEEIYVCAFPEPHRKWRISTEGGAQPQWSPDGRELFYRNGDKMMAVAISTDAEFTPGIPELLFEGRYSLGIGMEAPVTNYDVSHDGQRFVMVRPEESSGPVQFHVIINWFEELERLVPVN